MTALKFYLPSNGEDQDLLKYLWDNTDIPYMIFVQRMSFRGNPYTKGVIILDNESTMIPPELICTPLRDDYVAPLVNEFREELLVQNNGTELGSLWHIPMKSNDPLLVEILEIQSRLTEKSQLTEKNVTKN